jgi:hypothetical protein
MLLTDTATALHSGLEYIGIDLLGDTHADKLADAANALCLQLDVDSRPEAFAEVEKVVPKLVAAIDDAHFKVQGQVQGQALPQPSSSALLIASTHRVCWHVVQPSAIN